MLSDPQSITIDGSARTMPRVGSTQSSRPQLVAQSTYRTADGVYSIATQSFRHRQSGQRRAEVILRKVVPDLSSSTNYVGDIISGVGLVFETDPFGYGNSDLSNVRTALLSLVDTTLMNRIVAGEV